MGKDVRVVQCEGCKGSGERHVRIQDETMTWCAAGECQKCIGELEEWSFGNLVLVRRCDCDCGHG